MHEKGQAMPPNGRKRPRGSSLSVRCIISDRWLSFPAQVEASLQCGEVMTVNVMTRGAKGKPRKICELIVTREDLLDTLEQIAKADH